MSITRFEHQGGCVIGRDHCGEKAALPIDDNQDSFAIVSQLERSVLVVTDGSSDRKGSGAGAKMGAHLVANATFDVVDEIGEGCRDEDLIEEIDKRCVQRMEALVDSLTGLQPMADGRSALGWMAEQFLLFTILGAVVLRDRILIFGCGDGVYAINKEVITLPKSRGGPAYLGYRLYPSLPETHPECRLQLHRVIPIGELNTLLMGTDGCSHIQANKDQPLEGEEMVGDLLQFVSDESYFTIPNAITARLRRINSSYPRLVEGPGSFLRRGSAAIEWSKGGYLEDDATLVVLRPQPVEVPIDVSPKGAKRRGVRGSRTKSVHRA